MNKDNTREKQVNNKNESPISDGGIQLKDSHKKSFLSQRKYKLAIILFATLILSGAAIWFYTDIGRNSSNNNTVQTNNGSNIFATQSEQEDFSNSILNDTLDGKTEEAIKKIQSNPKIAGSAYGYEQVAIVYYNSNQTDKAIASLEESVKKYGLVNDSTANLMAMSYDKANNKQKAIEYYQKYIQMIQAKSDYPMKKADVQEALSKIKTLESK